MIHCCVCKKNFWFSRSSTFKIFECIVIKIDFEIIVYDTIQVCDDTKFIVLVFTISLLDQLCDVINHNACSTFDIESIESFYNSTINLIENINFDFTTSIVIFSETILMTNFANQSVENQTTSLKFKSNLNIDNVLLMFFQQFYVTRKNNNITTSSIIFEFDSHMRDFLNYK